MHKRQGYKTGDAGAPFWLMTKIQNYILKELLY